MRRAPLSIGKILEASGSPSGHLKPQWLDNSVASVRLSGREAYVFVCAYASAATSPDYCDMPYQHDVFICYRRDAAWTPWTREHFKELLRPYLKEDLGHEPEIFIDERIEVGADWVDGLGENLAKSKVVVALFSGSYFDSDWCVHELDLIVERARQFTSGFLPEARLIIPVVGHDGEQIPDPVNRIQSADVKDYRIAWINKNAPDYPEFSKVIKKLSPFVAKAVETAPNFDDNWIAYYKKRFREVYEARKKGTRLPPTQFALKSAPPPTALPQIKP